MSNMPSCTDRDKEALIAYLYDECSPAERDRVEAHLHDCARCADEASSFQGVQESLGTWTVAAPALGLRIVSPRQPGSWRRALGPALGLAAASGVVIGVALALGGAEVRYGDDALVLRFGRPAAPTARAPRAAGAAAAWQTDLVALENELRRDLAPGASADRDRPAGAADDDGALLDQVRSLIAESERRLQRERALWLIEFAQELDMQRRADQQQLQQELGALEGYADYLVRVSR